ncbi:hypothetical protein Ga0466249_004856 [Sporomusaceae bacterium BoRhaA]|uniref:membrane-associated protease 1 n=1 Tax=Pelorhabdus rhamnosifermentans TaxID=2772457 RepID=UPI001FEA00CD|nr:membrane-associated protease 1 [Pelorhabdus rhamnosifermentans]MBU2703708.1 hypothetical protein [Pelorhabdus rhamnosifermentans]
MGFTLAVTRQDTIYFGTDIISFVNADVGTPTNSMAKSSKGAITMIVTGKLTSNNSEIGKLTSNSNSEETNLTNSDTVKLFQWSLVSAQSSDAYRSVVVEVKSAGQTFRTIHLPHAFIVDYNERYNTTTGMGEFVIAFKTESRSSR